VGSTPPRTKAADAPPFCSSVLSPRAADATRGWEGAACSRIDMVLPTPTHMIDHHNRGQHENDRWCRVTGRSTDARTMPLRGETLLYYPYDNHPEKVGCGDLPGLPLQLEPAAHGQGEALRIRLLTHNKPPMSAFTNTASE
jgi:hypothetical protein